MHYAIIKSTICPSGVRSLFGLGLYAYIWFTSFRSSTGVSGVMRLGCSSLYSSLFLLDLSLSAFSNTMLSCVWKGKLGKGKWDIKVNGCSFVVFSEDSVSSSAQLTSQLSSKLTPLYWRPQHLFMCDDGIPQVCSVALCSTHFTVPLSAHTPLVATTESLSFPQWPPSSHLGSLHIFFYHLLSLHEFFVPRTSF